MYSSTNVYQNFMKLGLSRQIFEKKNSNIRPVDP